MRKITLISIIFICCVGTVFAQLGKFPGEIAKIYGTPVEEGRVKGGIYQTFKKGKLTVKIFFKNGRSDLIQVYKLIDSGGIVKYKYLNTDEIDKFMRSCSDGQKWYEAVAKTTNVKVWNRADKHVSANYNKTTKILTIRRGKSSAYSTSSSLDSGSDYSDEDTTGFQWSILPNVMIPDRKRVAGYKLGFFFSSPKSRIDGVDTAVFYSGSNGVYGFQTAFVCITGKLEGYQAAAVCVAESVSGVQTGVVNVVKNDSKNALTKGVQFGLVNYTENMDGIQFGLVNIIKNGQFVFLPFFNFNSPE